MENDSPNELNTAEVEETNPTTEETEEGVVETDAPEDDKLEDAPEQTHRKSWYTVDLFLFFLTSFQLINLLTLTYTDSVLNFISKRFQIPNIMASFIPSSYQVGNVVAIIPVSYFGAKWHRPRAICIGIMMMILGLGFCILPHFIQSDDLLRDDNGASMLCKRNGISPFLYDKYRIEFAKHNMSLPSTASEDNIARLEDLFINYGSKSDKAASWLTNILESISANYHKDNRLISPNLATPTDLPCNPNATTYNPSVLLIIGHIFIGAGSSPLWPLGVSYLDDHISSRKMPLYLGIFIATTLTGPVAGFLLGSLSSVIYVTIDSHHLTPSDPAWIGAWWLGYVIAGGLLVLLLVPFYFFPERLDVSEEKRKEREDQLNKIIAEADKKRERLGDSETLPLISDSQSTKDRILNTLKDAWMSTARVLSSPLVICCFVAYIALSNLLSGVSTFGSTFVQREYNIMRMTADMLIGGVCVPLAIAGTFLGGFIMKRYDFNTNQSLLFNVMMSTIGTIMLTVLFALGCQTTETAGLNHPYLQENKVSLVSECNSDCSCNHGELNLLCSKDNITYISPCYAGCMTHIHGSQSQSVKEQYVHCSCVPDSSQPLDIGPCSTVYCQGLLAGAIIMASLANLILCLCQAPTYSMLLRELRDDDKPLAIGILTFLSRILGFIPAPIWFGLVIDNSCIYWGPKCRGKAFCQLYNSKGLHLNFVGACTACSFLYSVVFAVGAAWSTLRERNKKADATRRTRMIRDRLARMRSFTR